MRCTRIEFCSEPNWHNVRYILLLTVVSTSKLRNHESCRHHPTTYCWIRACAHTQTPCHSETVGQHIFPSIYSNIFKLRNAELLSIHQFAISCHTRWLTACLLIHDRRTHTHTDLQIDFAWIRAKSCAWTLHRHRHAIGNWWTPYFFLDFHTITVLHHIDMHSVLLLSIVLHDMHRIVHS